MIKAKGRPQAHRDRLAVVLLALALLLQFLPLSSADAAANPISTIAGTGTADATGTKGGERLVSKVRTHTASTDLVPLSERIRYMQLFRLAVATVVLFAAWAVPGALGAGFEKLSLVTVAYVSTALVGEAAWQLTRRSTLLFGGLLIVDGLYLAWVSYLAGGIISPFHFLILLHLISVALLASYRTG